MKLGKNYLFFLLISSILFLSSCEKEEVTSITIDKPTLSMVKGDKNLLIATVRTKGDIAKFPVTWESSNSSIIKVFEGGIIEAIAAGTVTISAHAGDKLVTSIVTSTDEIAPTFMEGNLVYYGDTLHSHVSNLFRLVLLNQLEALDIFINTDTLATDSLPSGKYSVLPVNITAKELKEFSIISGINGGTTYYGNSTGLFGQSVRSIETGNIVVTATKSGYYKINYVFIDVNRTIIYGIYNGPLEFYNYKKAKGRNNCINESIRRLPINLTNFKLANF